LGGGEHGLGRRRRRGGPFGRPCGRRLGRRAPRSRGDTLVRNRRGRRLGRGRIDRVALSLDQTITEVSEAAGLASSAVAIA
jgi:hypothetical protein